MDNEEGNSKYSNIRGERREKQQARAARNQPRKATGARGRRRDYQITVRSELRKEPDLRKIARAVIQMALDQAEQEKAAQAQANDDVTNPVEGASS